LPDAFVSWDAAQHRLLLAVEGERRAIGTSVTELSALILELQRLAAMAQPDDFRAQAFLALQSHVPFKAAIWGDVIFAVGAAMQQPALFGLDPKVMPDIECAMMLDPNLPLVLGNAGRAVAYSTPVDAHPTLARINAAHDNHHFLSIIAPGPVREMASGLSLLRSAREPAFSESERSFVEALFGHLSRSWIVAQVSSSGDPTDRPQVYRALVTQTGLIQAENSDFVDLLRQEWPSWSGPRVPEALVKAPPGRLLKRYRGRSCVALSRTRTDLSILWLRPRCVADNLTPRELEIARLFAAGARYRDVARQLHITPATARNHLSNIHGKLETHHITEIVSALRQHDFAA
jgi:DNA-binding CsgD family transcriptional regulator